MSSYVALYVDCLTRMPLAAPLTPWYDTHAFGSASDTVVFFVWNSQLNTARDEIVSFFMCIAPMWIANKKTFSAYGYGGTPLLLLLSLIHI